ncbi:Photosynthetic apparatus regulatory protein RegA [Myxococcaceae bacterium]|jgi:two-component system response regulator RegA|nr:Photosynthetic apparatus regulatory protein RegA [Myxococcaceae bacterium]
MSSAPAATPRSVLIVDDDERFRSRLALAFRELGYEVREAESAEKALEISRLDSPEYAVVDLRMPGMGGLEAVRRLKQIDSATNVVVLTGYGSIATALEAVRLGATHYLTKPVEIEQLLAAFERSSLSPLEDLPTPDTVPSLARAEWEHINRVLTECGGNISQAARLLGLHRRSLQRKLAKYPVAR